MANFIPIFLGDSQSHANLLIGMSIIYSSTNPGTYHVSYASGQAIWHSKQNAGLAAEEKQEISFT